MRGKSSTERNQQQGEGDLRKFASVRSLLSPDKFPPFFTWQVFPSYGMPNARYCASSIFGDCPSHIGIYDGDSLIIRMTKEVPDGALAVVLTLESPLAKFIHREKGGRVCLYTGSPDFTPLYYRASDVRIIGQVVRVERDLDHFRQPKGGQE